MLSPVFGSLAQLCCPPYLHDSDLAIKVLVIAHDPKQAKGTQDKSFWVKLLQKDWCAQLPLPKLRTSSTLSHREETPRGWSQCRIEQNDREREILSVIIWVPGSSQSLSGFSSELSISGLEAKRADTVPRILSSVSVREKWALPSSFPKAITKLSESPILAPRKLEKNPPKTQTVGRHSEWT